MDKVRLPHQTHHRKALCNEKYSTEIGISSTDNEVFGAPWSDRNGESISCKPENGVEIPEKIG